MRNVDNASSLVEKFHVLKSDGRSTEEALNGLVSECRVLLRGSVEYMSDNFVRPTLKDGTCVYATNLASIAILNAVFSKEGNPTLEYPFYIDERHPMELRIHNINEKTVCGRGLVYIITDRAGFLRTPMGSWQYVKNSVKVPYDSKIGVRMEDFVYPVYDVDNGVRLQ